MHADRLDGLLARHSGSPIFGQAALTYSHHVNIARILAPQGQICAVPPQGRKPEIGLAYSNWTATGARDQPAETPSYVLAITGHLVEDWLTLAK